MTGIFEIFSLKIVHEHLDFSGFSAPVEICSLLAHAKCGVLDGKLASSPAGMLPRGGSAPSTTRDLPSAPGLDS